MPSQSLNIPFALMYVFASLKQDPIHLECVVPGTVGEPKKPRIYTRYTAVGRIVAIGDLHGDAVAFRLVTQQAGIADTNGDWNGDKTVVVQTGDNCDRGPDCREILHGWFKLREQARNAGGDVVLLLGNHEALSMTNSATLKKYVTEADYAKFGGSEARRHAFQPDGELGRYLAELQPSIQIGQIVFSHAGYTAEYAQLGVDGYNTIIRQVLDLWKVDSNPRIPYNALVMDVGSPLWTRKYGALAKGEQPGACGAASKALKLLRAEHMVIAHNPSSKLEVTSRCDDTVHLIDAKLSRYMNPKKIRQSIRPSYLEILDMTKFVPHNPPSQDVSVM